MSSPTRNLLFWLVAALTIYAFWIVSARIQRSERQLRFSEFIEQLERGHIAKVTFTGNSILGEFKNGQGFRTYVPPQAEGLVDKLLEKGVAVNARDVNSSSWLGHIISWTPIVIMIAFLIFFMRQLQGGTDQRTQARIWYLLSRSKEGLSEAEISSGVPGASGAALRDALYRMVRERTIVFTTEGKYRVKAAD
jgi:ATP-dependent Zn protease